MPEIIKACSICGNSFTDTTRNHNKKYCSRDCDKIADNIALRKWRASHPQEDRDNSKKWRTKNTDRVAKYQKQWRRDALDNNLIYQIKHSLRCRLHSALSRGHKHGSAVRDLGCSIEELKSYIESKFQEGMNWDNWTTDGWHLDHIIPLASFDLTNPEEFKKACHYTNLQPLWAKDNLAKSGKTPND